METLRIPGPSFPLCVTAAWRLLAAFSLAACAAWGQITTGSLSGTVTDPAGAVVVGAAIKVTNQATGVSVSLVTNEAGVFKAAFLTPGTYTVVVQAAGFRTFETIYNTLAADQFFGTPFGVGRNTLTGPSLQQLNLSIYKDFAIRERLRLELRGEATNALIPSITRCRISTWMSARQPRS